MIDFYSCSECRAITDPLRQGLSGMTGVCPHCRERQQRASDPSIFPLPEYFKRDLEPHIQWRIQNHQQPR